MGEFIASRLSLGQAHTAAARLLREARIAAPELDARLLLCHATGLSHEACVAALNDPFAPDAAARFGAFVERRLEGEPVSRIIGIREFYGRSFRIDASTLDPRPDTETLIEAALGFEDRETPLSILDLGTGSGCILVTQQVLEQDHHREGQLGDAHEAILLGLGQGVVSVGLAAGGERLATLKAVQRHRLRVLQNHLLRLHSAADMAALSPEVRDHDPRPALDGGPDGLSAYRRIVPSLRKALRPGGFALFEIGPGQAQAVLRLLAEVGLEAVERQQLWRDLAGRARVVGARLRVKAP